MTELQSDSQPVFPVDLCAVGIKNVKKILHICFESIDYYIPAEIEVKLSLAATQRGVHMSRIASAIEEICIGNKVFINIEEVANQIMDRIKETCPESERIHLKIEGSLYIGLQQRPFKIKFIAHQDSRRYAYIGITATGMTACPCAQHENKEYYNKEYELDKDVDGRAFLQNIPMISHNQRAYTTIFVPEPHCSPVINIIELIKVLELSMSAAIQPVLKRNIEAEIVRDAHNNPRFVEDVVRYVAYNLFKVPELLQRLDYHRKLDIICETEESIHYHNAIAELSISPMEICMVGGVLARN